MSHNIKLFGFSQAAKKQNVTQHKMKAAKKND